MSAGPHLELAVEVPPETLPLPEADLCRLVAEALVLCGFDGALSLAVVDDETMRGVNRDFHDQDRATDVLAFPLERPPGVPADTPGVFDAEVVVSLDTARREAEARGVEPAAELLLYVVHGVLHLLGEDDHEPGDARRMHRRTLDVLEGLGLRNVIEVPSGE